MAGSKREQILLATLAVINEEGLQSASIAQITQRAGVGMGTLYNYFDSKEVLVNELFRQLFGDLERYMTAGFDNDATPKERFFWLFHRLVDYCLANPEAFQFIENHAHSPYIVEDIRVQMEASMEPFEELFSTVGSESILPPLLQVKMVYGALTALIKGHHDGKLTLTDEIVDAALAQCWVGVSA